jgi:hypothetical protein
MTHASAEAAARFETEMMTRSARSTKMFAPGDVGQPPRRAVAQPVADYLSARGAAELADRIKQFWQASGHVVEISIEQFHTARSGSGGFGIRSDLFNGKPR